MKYFRALNGSRFSGVEHIHTLVKFAFMNRGYSPRCSDVKNKFIASAVIEKNGLMSEWFIKHHFICVQNRCEIHASAVFFMMCNS